MTYLAHYQSLPHPQDQEESYHPHLKDQHILLTPPEQVGSPEILPPESKNGSNDDEKSLIERGEKEEEEEA